MGHVGVQVGVPRVAAPMATLLSLLASSPNGKTTKAFVARATVYNSALQTVAGDLVSHDLQFLNIA